MEKKIFPSQYSQSTRLNILSLVSFLWQPDSSKAESSVWVGIQLRVAIVSGRMRRRGRWQLIAVHLLCVRNVLQCEGISRASADAKRGQAAQVAWGPWQIHLGSMWQSHHAAVELTLRKPRRNLQQIHGVQVRYEGWVLNPSWMNKRNWISTSGFYIMASVVLNDLQTLFIIERVTFKMTKRKKYGHFIIS